LLTSSSAGLAGNRQVTTEPVRFGLYRGQARGSVGLMRFVCQFCFAPHSIRVNSVHPSGVPDTPMINNEFHPATGSPKMVEETDTTLGKRPMHCRWRCLQTGGTFANRRGNGGFSDEAALQSPAWTFAGRRGLLPQQALIMARNPARADRLRPDGCKAAIEQYEAAGTPPGPPDGPRPVNVCPQAQRAHGSPRCAWPLLASA